MKRFKKFLAEDMTTAATTGGSKEQNSEPEEYKPGSPEFQRRIREVLPNFLDNEKPSEERPDVGPNSLTPEEIEFLNNGEPNPSDYQNGDEWRDAIERYWRLYFQYFGAYQNSPDLPDQIANDAYDRWMKENWEFEWLRQNPPPEIQNYSSEEEYQRAFDEWIKDLEYERWQ